MTHEILTIGYARATQDALVAALKGARIDVLADIRALPLSRRPGFSKTSLRAAVEQAGMEYIHIRELGTPKEGREAARKGDLVTLREIYSGQLQLPEAMARMAKLQSLALERRVCLLCYCETTEQCHRGLLIEAAFTQCRRIDLDAAPLVS
ncbi:DUF488 family protein [Aurantiacibacter aquimixticola]|uniref:DUF488 domain-containing protein n=1 Tax=Aurantiacibacter aquimixticola TaxID=1958945 RepID=A0A419RSA1_9SPHN|nr:DUF488 domain-containing protein [Aurantiacibacter aquimixticola]RJY08660.1 DUF488 domain-containing protein [Aurantiacibacter aquimixticola]